MTDAQRCQRSGVLTTLLTFEKDYFLRMYFALLGWSSSCQVKQSTVSQTWAEQHLGILYCCSVTILVPAGASLQNRICEGNGYPMGGLGMDV